ncbi:MAG: hypothetical protein KF770_09530 [Anaerolineae bacterium]|nr:hypothetical protein [Anaerolineae bacterium]
MITVKVLGNDGRPVNGADVRISWREYTHSTGRTNSSGQVSWDVSPGSGTIYVDGTKVHEGQISGTMTFYK